MSRQAMNIRITKKLQQLVDLLRHTEKKQLTARQLEQTRQDFKFITDLQDSYNDGTGLTQSDMRSCNVLWKRYNG